MPPGICSGQTTLRRQVGAHRPAKSGLHCRSDYPIMIWVILDVE
jgi:hypothetical protein